MRLAPVATVVVAALSSNCVSCGGESAPPSDADIAVAVCDALRAYDNALVDVVNESVEGISELSPEARREAVTGGMTGAVEVVTHWRQQIADVELPDTAEGTEIRDQLDRGAVAALEELEDQARESVESGPVPDDDVQGQVGIWFNSIEKVMSVSEPTIFKLERFELKQAFLDEPNCRNVIQQFVND